MIRLEMQHQVAGWANNSTSSTSVPSDVSGTVQSIEDAGWTVPVSAAEPHAVVVDQLGKHRRDLHVPSNPGRVLDHTTPA